MLDKILTRIGDFSYRFRYAILVVGVLLLVAAAILQSYAGISYTYSDYNEVTEVFPEEDTLVLLYRNEDEEAVKDIIAALEVDEGVSSVFAYPNTLGKEMSAEEMTVAVGSFSEDISIEEDIIRMLYYMALEEGLPVMTVSEMMTFLTQSILPNEAFSAYFDESIEEYAGYLQRFSDREALLTPLSAEEMASFFGIEKNDVGQLFLFYSITNGVEDSGEMTLPVFMDFLLNTVAEDKTYGAMLDPSVTAQLGQLYDLLLLAVSGRALTPQQMADALGVTADEAAGLYYLFYAEDEAFLQEASAYKMTLSELFELAKRYATGEQLEQLEQTEDVLSDIVKALKILFPNANIEESRLVQSLTSGIAFDAQTMSELLGVDEASISQLFGLALASQKSLALADFTAFLVGTVLTDAAYADSFTEEQAAQLRFMNQLVQASVNGESFTSAEIAALLGMESQQAEQLYILYMDANGAPWRISVREFVRFAVESVLSNEAFAGQLDGASASELRLAHTLIEAVVSERAYAASEMTELFSLLTEQISETEVELMYLYYGGVRTDGSQRKMSIQGVFDFLCNELLADERFEVFFDGETRELLLSSKEELNAAVAQMKGESYARVVITSDYADESQETKDFVAWLHETCGSRLGEYYLIGSTAMTHELSGSFRDEYLMISLITAIAIFLVIALSFKKISVPLFLVCIIECAVFITMSSMTVTGGSMYFIAVIIVQCVLMGAMVDYGILLTNYYIEVREECSPDKALPEVLKRSVRAIAMSAIIMIVVTFVCGLLMNGAVASILMTICIGAFSALLLVVFVLPSLLAVFDKLIVKKKKA